MTISELPHNEKCIVANHVTEFYRNTVFLSSAVFYFSGVSLRIIIILISTFICYICSVTLSYMKKFTIFSIAAVCYALTLSCTDSILNRPADTPDESSVTKSSPEVPLA